MKITIRSQGKDMLSECDNLMIIDKEQEKNIKDDCFYFVSIMMQQNNYYTVFGKYSSKEKAIKVLDMIQEHIENNNNYFENLNFGTDYGGLIVTQQHKVFNMPLDEEVEV